MRQAPQRVTRLALLDTRSRPEQPEETERRRQFMKLAQAERGFTPVTNRMLPLMLHESRAKDAELVKIIREMAAAIPGAKLVIVEECGHMSTLERPNEVNRAMRSWFSGGAK